MKKFLEVLKKIKCPVLISLILIAICGLIYPITMTGVSQLIFHDQANGSLIEVNGEVVGSKHIGQQFTKPYFMKGRPSAVDYNTYYIDENGNKVYLDGSEFTGPASGGSNLAPSNEELEKRIENDIEKFLEANKGVKKEEIPIDLLTQSGSGLDPHISIKSAMIQLPAIQEASGLSMEVLEQIVKDNTKGKFLWIFGEETVNVLGVNLDIAEKMGLIS